MNSDTTFVFFDLGNVLLSFDHRRACRQLAELSGCTTDEVWEAIFGSDLEWRYERGELGTDDFFCELTRRLDCGPPTADWVTAAADIFDPQPGVREIVMELAARDLRLGLFSNTNAIHWEFVCRQFPWIQRTFEVHALSFELGAMKPETAAYARARKAAGVDGTIVFVDDRFDNVHAARTAGWDAFQFETAERLRRDLSQRGLLDRPPPAPPG